MPPSSSEKIEVLLPERARGVHAGHRDEYYKSPHTRPMGLGLTLAGLRKGGTEFPVEISLSHIRTKHGGNAVAFVNDISASER